MRRSFDESFALPTSTRVDSVEDLLAVRVSGDAYALRLSEIAGLHVDLRIAPLPGAAAHLLGIAAIRGVMAPVYDLAGLLGYPPAVSSRWVALVRTPHLVGLALEYFEAHLRIRQESVSAKAPEDRSRASRYSRDAVKSDGGLRPILQVSTLIQSLREKTS